LLGPNFISCAIEPLCVAGVHQ